MHEIVRRDCKRDKFCAFVHSHSDGDPMRDDLFDALSAYKRVDSGGRHRNNIGEGVEDKIDFLSQYKFSIAAENQSQPGYTTEKIVDAFMAGGIPIYWGDPLITSEFNPTAFINCHDFTSLDEVVAYVKKVDGDDELYRRMLAESILNDKDYIEKKKKELENFLVNIFETPLSEARKNAPYLHKREHLKKLRLFIPRI